MNYPAKIIIVDDHPLFREGMKLLIEKEGLGEIIAEAENGSIFLSLLETHSPDLVLMDIEMPVMGGVEATRRAVARNPCIKILVLTMLNRKENYSDMINAGAMGFVLKTSGKKELECAIKAVLDGESYFSSELLRQIILNNGREPQVNTFATSAETELTERELEVLGYLCQGYSVNEIAEQLFRSIKTIEAHRSKLLEKTATKNTINLVLFAIKHKIVSI